MFLLSRPNIVILQREILLTLKGVNWLFLLNVFMRVHQMYQTAFCFIVLLPPKPSLEILHNRLIRYTQ